MKEADERYSTVEDAIYDAFFLLLKEKSVDRITVSDVVKKAGIVRSTFYNHYENIPSLVLAAEDRTISDIFRLMESFHAKNNRDMCRSYYLAICNYFGESDPSSFSYFVAGAIGSTLGVLHKWIAEDFASPAEEIADILARIFVSGILPYLNTAAS